MGDFTQLEIVGRHVPDENSGPFTVMQQAQAAGYDVLNPVTGVYEIGVMLDGAFIPLVTEKASLVFDKVEQAKQAAADAQAAQPAQPPAEQSAMQTGETQPASDAPADPNATPPTQPQG